MRLHAALLLATAVSSSALADADEAAPASLPLPSPAGKPIAIAPGQRVFRLPVRFARVEAFYRERFAGERRVTIALDRGADGKTLTITSRREGDAWAKAVVREEAVVTVVEVTPVFRIARPELVEGRGLPLVHLVLPPATEAIKQAANSIDHLGTGPGR